MSKSECKMIQIILPPLPDAKFPTFHFHISHDCRRKYDVNEQLFTINGNVIFINFASAQELAEAMNRVRNVKEHPELTIRAGLLQAMGLIDELLHYVVAQYRIRKKANVFSEAIDYLQKVLPKEELQKCLLAFINQFPPMPVYRGQETAEQYLNGDTDNYKNRDMVLEEMLLLYLANENPGFTPFLELFHDIELEQQTVYLPVMNALDDFFKTQPTFGPFNQTLIEMLKAPAKVAPYSLLDQLNYIKDYWLDYLPSDIVDKLLKRLLIALGIIKEEEKMRGFGTGEAPVIDFSHLRFRDRSQYPEYEPEQFSPDLDWMPNVVLIAKNIYVWMYQLSQKYQRDISKLDQIPDEELIQLRHYGFTALWLIGVWERSGASRKIKQAMGNPEALASAYSLYDYQIAWDLGGDEAYWRLKERAWHHGIRIAVDMVPNHTGIYSRWMVEHPDWFIQTSHPPFPSYSFSGMDLSDDPSVGMYLEDGYYNRSDAAVVFRRTDHRTGETRFIYHGNDGTHMPWNDTAQLNFLLPEVREAVIQQILKVARYSSVIRFDAAMTLTKKHYQRLWFPEPGAGGDIPSRAERGLTKEAFDQAMPNEFWREVVDRIAAENPQTLLLAEAFWLLEGFFVRTLGMHRVYNSAFMNMLKREDNASYRQTIKNILDFNPEILKRFVNFMNNPDEEPAAEQFGKGDKYFGVCLMMVTMPGLPMFGHGQIEGFYEKYGMEYARAYWNEHVDVALLERHQREIFPLLKRRYLFSEVEHFYLYEVHNPYGHIEHDIFAYSNLRGHEKVLIVYNNSYHGHSGWIKQSAGYRPGGQGKPLHKHILDALQLSHDGWHRFRDMVTGLEYIQSAREISRKGLFVDLKGYQYHVFMEFQTITDPYSEYVKLALHLNGRGVPSLDLAVWEMRLQEALEHYYHLIGKESTSLFVQAVQYPDSDSWNRLTEILEKRLRGFVVCRQRVFPTDFYRPGCVEQIKSGVEEMYTFFTGPDYTNLRASHAYKRILRSFDTFDVLTLETDEGLRRIYRLALQYHLLQIVDQPVAQTILWNKLREFVMHDGKNESQAWNISQLIKILVTRPVTRHRKPVDWPGWNIKWQSPEVQQYLYCNWHNEVLWFNKEQFLSLVYWAFFAVLTQYTDIQPGQTYRHKRRFAAGLRQMQTLIQLAEYAQYNFNLFLKAVEDRKII